MSEQKEIELFFNDGSLMWFVEMSYRQYIAPIGFWEHVKFAIHLPFAAFRYSSEMRNARKALEQDT